MKIKLSKTVSFLILSAIFLLSTVSCEQIDLHDYQNGICTKCLDIQSGSPEEQDLSVNDCITSRKANRYGSKSTLTKQNVMVSQNSHLALKGVFNSDGAETYNGYQVWTLVEIDLVKAFGDTVDLRNKALQFDLKKENCGENNSVQLTTSSYISTQEKSFSSGPEKEVSFVHSVLPLENNWMRICLNFSTLYESDKYIHESTFITLVFNNINATTTADHVFYLDNMHLINADDANTIKDFYNPIGYYSKSEPLSIRVVGNSFVNPYFSNSSGILKELCDENGANVSVDYTSIGNAQIINQIEAAFGSSGYITNGKRYNIIFVQDFYNREDFNNMAVFLSKLFLKSPYTEVKIYPGENESGDGERSANYYGLDLVDWKTAIKSLKSSHGFTTEQLNAYDGWHPNELSGYIGAIMMYMDLYGEEPSLNSLHNIANTYVWHYLPGATDAEKQASIETILSVAKDKLGME